MNPIMYGLLVTLFGITIIFLVLTGLWGILTMMKAFFGGKKTQKSQVAIESKLNTPSEEVTATKVLSEEMDADELLAVITAAICACMGGQNNLYVRKITRVGDNTPIWGQISRHEQTLNRL
jgi:sodium pump decarboxylase gamma subunit